MKLFPPPSVKMNFAERCAAGRRVVSTGAGAESPNGTGALDCQVAAEVKNHQAYHFLPARELRRVGRAMPLMLAATREALGHADVAGRSFACGEA
ncbi:MAG: hypothetical protein FJ143_15960 [Deltaproteobacteria bacterium]|nr:hypothetical protein [Deltaproteobacteria bacterium]